MGILTLSANFFSFEETFTVLWFQLLRFEVELTMASSLRAKLEQARPSRASCSWGSSSTNSPLLVYLGQKKVKANLSSLFPPPALQMSCKNMQCRAWTRTSRYTCSWGLLYFSCCYHLVANLTAAPALKPPTITNSWSRGMRQPEEIACWILNVRPPEENAIVLPKCCTR